MSELDKWLDDIERNGRAGWIRYYKYLFHRPIPNPERFWQALEMYGVLPVFEATMLTSTRKIDGDPMSYLLSVAHSKWKQSVEGDEAQAKYRRGLDRAKESTAERNAELADKLKRARELAIDPIQ